jgi:hypothetical protein
MKTPREILLERHQQMEWKLDAVRRRALAACAVESQTSAPSWREWLLSLRWQLAGMGAVWLAVLILQGSASTNATEMMAREKTPSARVLMMGLVNNRRALIELTEAPVTPEPAAIPPRRSDAAQTFEMA